MKKPEIRVLFFDFGNVCATYEFERFIRSFSAHTGIPEHLVLSTLNEGINTGVHYSPLFLDLESGKISPHQFFHQLTAILDCADRIDYETFARLWVDIFLEENTALDTLLSLLPQKKYLLSNTNHIVHARYIAECGIIRRHFPFYGDRVLSYEVGAVKPEIKIWDSAFARANVQPEQAVFIDDLPANIAGWRARGGHGIVYNAHIHSIEYLTTELQKFGIMP